MLFYFIIIYLFVPQKENKIRFPARARVHIIAVNCTASSFKKKKNIIIINAKETHNDPI